MQPNKKVLLLTTTLSSFLTPFMASSINLALPSIGKDFAADAITLTWIPTIYLLAAAVFLLPLGKLADIYGRRKFFVAGIIIFTTGSFLCAAAPTTQVLLIFRVFQGFGGAMVFGTGVALLSSVFPIEERGKVLGINTGAVYLGASLGPVLGGVLTQHFTWRSIFFFNVVLGIVVAVLTLIYLKFELKPAQGEKFDVPGSVIYGFSLVFLLVGLSELSEGNGIYFLTAGIAGIVGFGIFELRTQSPLLNLRLFRRNTVFMYSSLATLINYAATAGVGFLMSLYLQYGKGLSPQSAGFIIVSQAIVMTAVAPVAGRLSDRVEPRLISSAGMGLTFLALLLLSLVEVSTPLLLVVPALVMLGVGLGLFSSPNANAIMSSVEKKEYGVASATIATMRIIGQMSSLAITMLAVAIFIGKVEITAARIPNLIIAMKTVLLIFAGLCFFGILASLKRGNLRG
ncbi:MAG: MFS transporter [Thermoplasmata archaeon]|nr:MFS transporter [Thermoplasmata archaeon]